MPRTLLSDVNAAESPTALVAQRELAAWQFLQLEPSAMRRADDFDAPARVAVNGAHIAKALWLRAEHRSKHDGARIASTVYADLARRLSGAIDDVTRIRVEADDKRELLTLKIERPDGSVHAANALSDGTLRLLALAILSIGSDPSVLCLEEPENGIHPQRIDAMLQLLDAMAVDTECAVGADNPMRQVFINTHSPGVVTRVDSNALLLARVMDVTDKATGIRCKAVRFLPAPDTWRSGSDAAAAVQRPTDLLAYRIQSGPKELHRREAPPASESEEQQLELKLA